MAVPLRSYCLFVFLSFLMKNGNPDKETLTHDIFVFCTPRQ